MGLLGFSPLNNLTHMANKKEQGRVREFLKGLNELTRKTNLVITSTDITFFEDVEGDYEVRFSRQRNEYICVDANDKEIISESSSN